MENRKEKITRILMILVGSLISALAINSFIIPHKLISGGVTGIAIIIEYMANIPTGILILVINIPIFIFGMKEIDKEFIVYSLLGTISNSIFLLLTQGVSRYIHTDNILLSCVYGGAFAGVGLGLILKNGGSLGGIDIIAVAFKRKTGINVSTLSFIMNIIIVGFGAFISNVDIILYTLMSMYITTLLMDRVIEGLDRKKLLFIVTEKEEEVSAAIMKNLGRGVTYLYGEGAYTGDRKRVLYCIVPLKQLIRVKRITESIDELAFITIIDASEVQGSGFKKQSI
ncbi:MAG: YitT family protein [Clostridium sp.]|uniref:YitT family protein n=1 Tax=Clostridium sp. TaxID=1506 RepID=UPI002FC7F2A7